MYEKEVVQQTEKIEKMKTEGKDEYDIKKMVTPLLVNCKQFFFSFFFGYIVIVETSFLWCARFFL